MLLKRNKVKNVISFHAMKNISNERKKNVKFPKFS